MTGRRKRRRTAAEMVEVREGLVKIAEEHQPATVRQIFYLAVSAGLIDKTEVEYKSTVCRLLSDARLNGTLSWRTVVDHTRGARRARTYDGLEGVFDLARRTYRRAMWEHQADRVEVWTEKDTLSGVLSGTTMAWDVALFPTRGYPSLSFLYDCAEDIEIAGKPTQIYYLGDHDPSGRDIRRMVFQRLQEFAPNVEIHFTPLAVTEQQIDEMSLPMRPTKWTDSRAKGWIGGSVEVEAIPPDALRKLVHDAIIQHIDPDEWRRIAEAERSETEVLNLLSRANVNEIFEDSDGALYIPPRDDI